MMPQIRRFLSLRQSCAAFALAAGLAPGSALADSADATVTHLVSQRIEVTSNGSSYHATNHLANLVADVRIEVDTGIAGHVKSWKIWLGLAGEHSDALWFPHYGAQKSYPWYNRPQGVDRTERLMVPEVAWGGYVRARCNELADNLRAQGLGNTAIFAEDRQIELAVKVGFDVDTTGAGSGSILAQAAPWAAFKKIELVCKKWPGAAIPQASDSIATTPAKVVSKGLSILERSAVSGACKIRLDGWITTDRKHADVSFRYRNQEGKQSQVWTVNSGETKTATFSHWYDIPKTEWTETGSVRMVGVSHDFQSGWAEYNIDCVEGGPQALTANLPPKLTMTVVEQGKVMVRGQICPERLKLVGLLEGRGNYSGRTIFFGPGYLSPPRDYTITHGQKVLVGADVELKWEHILAPANALLSQKRSFTFNATNEADEVVASLQNQTHTATCVRPAVNPVAGGGQGGLTIQPRQPPAPAATIAGPRALQQQTVPVPQLRMLPVPQTPRERVK